MLSKAENNYRKAASSYDWRQLGRVVVLEKDYQEFREQVRRHEGVEVNIVARVGNRLVVAK